MLKKIIIFLLLIPFAYGYELTTFDDGTSSKMFNFENTTGQQAYISIPQTASVGSFEFYATGVPFLSYLNQTFDDVFNWTRYNMSFTSYLAPTSSYDFTNDTVNMLAYNDPIYIGNSQVYNLVSEYYLDSTRRFNINISQYLILEDNLNIYVGFGYIDACIQLWDSNYLSQWNTNKSIDQIYNPLTYGVTLIGMCDGLLNTNSNYLKYNYTNITLVYDLANSLVNVTYNGAFNESIDVSSLSGDFYLVMSTSAHVTGGNAISVSNVTSINVTYGNVTQPLYPFNLTLSLSNISYYNNSDAYYKGINLFDYWDLNSALPDCSCLGCNVTDYNCFIPIFGNTSVLDGKLNLSTLSITYGLGSVYLNVTVVDVNTNNVIKYNMTIEVTNDGFGESVTTTDGYYIFNVSTLNSSSPYLTEARAFSSETTDYSIVSQEFNMYTGQNATITLYATNTSNTATTKLVRLHTQDEERTNLEDALIKIMRQDPENTNQYITLTELRSNMNGEAYFIFEIDTVYYKFEVKYNNDTIYYSTSPITISLSDEDIYLVGIVNPSFTDYYNSYFGSTTTLSYTIVQNYTSGYFESTFVCEETCEGCLNINILNRSGSFLAYNQCMNTTSGTLTSDTFTPINTTTYMAHLNIDFKDGEGFRLIRSKAQTIGLPSTLLIPKQEGLLIWMGLILLSAFGFMVTPIAGLLIMMLGSLGVYMTHLTPVPLSVTMIIVSLCVISLVTIYRITR